MVLSMGTGASVPRVLRFDHVSVEHGLSQSAVNCIYQDRSGIMWIGTENGLNRYNGFEFTVYKHDPRDPSSLAKDYIWSIAEDRSGRLWVGTDGGGLHRFDPLTGGFERWRHDPADANSLSNDFVRALVEGPDGDLWVGTDGGGLDRFDPDSGTWRHYRHDSGNNATISSDRVRTLYLDSENRLWVGSVNGGVDRLDAVSGSFRRHRFFEPTPGKDQSIFSLYEDREGFIWIGTAEDGLFRHHVATNQTTRFAAEDGQGLPSNRISSLIVDPSKTLWAGTDRGLAEWDPHSNSFTAYKREPSLPDSLSHDKVISLFVDRGGVMWVGTKAGGLNKWTSYAAVFKHYRRLPGQQRSLSNDIVTSFARDSSGDLWVGTFGGGLNRVDAGTGRITYYGPEGDVTDGLTEPNVMALLADDRDLWVGTRGSGLFRHDTRTGEWKHYPADPGNPEALQAPGVMKLYRTRDGGIWVGVFGGGVSRYDPSIDGFRTYLPQTGEEARTGNRVTAIVEDLSGVLWIGGDGSGLLRFDPMTESFEGFDSDDGLATDDIYSLHVDRANTLWIGTQGAGLAAWDAGPRSRHKTSFRRFDEHDGLPNNHVYGILEDERGLLWLSTNRGLSCFEPDQRRFRNFNVNHGIQSNEFNFGAYYRDSRGEMFFGGIQGYNAFFPSRIAEGGYQPPVVLTKVNRLGQPLSTDLQQITERGLELNHRDHVTSFHFAALDYSAPRNTRYAYRVVGLHDDWVQLEDNRVATLTRLDAGSYRLEVRGTNGNGDWSGHLLSVPLNVSPPPWLSWWAYTLYTFAGCGVLVAYVAAQRNKLRRKEQYSRQLEREVQERTRELAESNRELQELNRRLEDASLTDPLTGLHNRRYLTSRIEEDLAELARRQQPEVEDDGSFDILFLMVDLDGLKDINDHYGHLVGDRAILRMCQLLKRICRTSDTVVRWGGDEFMVIARRIPLEAAESLAERIRRAVPQERIELEDGRALRLSCSIGFAFFPFLEDDPERLTWEQTIGIADRALYVAKMNGRDAWACLRATEADNATLDYESLIDETEALVTRGSVAITTSIVDADELVWERAPRVRSAREAG